MMPSDGVISCRHKRLLCSTSLQPSGYSCNTSILTPQTPNPSWASRAQLQVLLAMGEWAMHRVSDYCCSHSSMPMAYGA